MNMQKTKMKNLCFLHITRLLFYFHIKMQREKYNTISCIGFKITDPTLEFWQGSLCSASHLCVSNLQNKSLKVLQIHTVCADLNQQLLRGSKFGGSHYHLKQIMVEQIILTKPQAGETKISLWLQLNAMASYGIFSKFTPSVKKTN